MADLIKAAKNFGIDDIYSTAAAGNQQLLKMVKPKEAPGLISNTFGEEIGNVVLIKKGEHLGYHNGFGIDHAFEEHKNFLIDNGIDSKEELVEKVDEIISNGHYNYVYSAGSPHEFTMNGAPIKVIINQDGSFQTIEEVKF